MSKKTGRIEYHSGFFAAIQSAYRHVRAGFKFPHEQELGIKPVRVDMVLVRRISRKKLLDAIGRFFRKLNVLEYKSPGVSLNISDIFKTQAYVCLCMVLKLWGRFAGDELTVTIFCYRHPRATFAELKRLGHVVEENYPGIYQVTGTLLVPTQIVVIPQLPPGEYRELKILAKGAKKEDILKFMEEAFDLYPREDVLAILRISMAANEETYKKLKEETTVVGAFERIMASFIAEREALSEERGRMEGRMEERQSFTDKLISIGWDPVEAAKFTGLSK